MKRRMTAVLAAIGMTAITLLGVAPAALADDSGNSAYVAVGDSEAAGTGVMPYSADPACLRSTAAYPDMLAAARGMTLFSAACAGATTAQTMQQVNALGNHGILGAGTKLVTITAGINDVAWQSILLTCATQPTQCQTAIATASPAVKALPAQIAGLVGLVRGWAPTARIVVTDYPLLFGWMWRPCMIGTWYGAPVTISPTTAAEANAALSSVNVAIASGVWQSGDRNARFADVAVGFTGHGLCGFGTPWINGLVDAPTGAGFPTSLHPNLAGERAYAAIIGWYVR